MNGFREREVGSESRRELESNEPAHECDLKIKEELKRELSRERFLREVGSES